MRKLFVKVYLPLAICIVLTLILSAYVAFKIVPRHIRDYQRRTLESFRDRLVSTEPLTIEKARSIADSMDITARFVPVRGPDRRLPRPRPGSVFLPGLPHSLPFQVEVSLTPFERGRPLFRNAFWLFILVLLLTEGAVLYLALFPLRKKLRRLRWAADNLGEGNLGIRIPAKSKGDILDSVGHTFNQMAQRIQDLVDSHRQLLGSVAHELRTPLARLSLSLELLRDTGGMEPAKMDRMERELHNLDRLVTELLDYNRLQRKDSVSRETVDLAEVAEEMVQAETWARTEIEVAVSGSARCLGDRHLLARALANLARNAIRHAESRVEVGLAIEDDRAVVTVSDDGPGYGVEDVTKLSRPFVKGPSSEGPGLGLTIVRRIAGLHGGALSLGRSDSLGGAKARLELPATKE
ncbi:HAMP domain-containing protein [Candidatus Fermentibacteria bacterium]|nr:HAMP domain-containing protein [Candidatus Fermentibacteria bacterium]